jgi:hypothetical protein
VDVQTELAGLVHLVHVDLDFFRRGQGGAGGGEHQGGNEYRFHAFSRVENGAPGAPDDNDSQLVAVANDDRKSTGAKDYKSRKRKRQPAWISVV